MTTTDAEAIARVIDPDAMVATTYIDDIGGRPLLTPSMSRRKEDALGKANRILSYLASRRDPVAYAIFSEDGSIRFWWPAGQFARAERYASENGLTLTTLYTTPPSPVPAPAGEVERLRGALNEIDALDPEQHISGCSADALRGLVIRMGEIARAALNGGRGE